MWIIRWIVGALLLILIIGFAMQNTSQLVQVGLWKWQSDLIPLWVVMYTSFVVGMLVWLIVSIFQILNLKAENRKVKKEVKNLRQELDRLRNLSVEESVELIEENIQEVDEQEKE